jgi:hypothetical protein
MNVRVTEFHMMKDGVPEVDEPGKPIVRRRGLAARKDFKAGEVIYRVRCMLSMPQRLHT